MTPSQPKLHTKILRYAYNIVVIYVLVIVTDSATPFQLTNDRSSFTREFSNMIWALAKDFSLLTTITLSVTNQENFQQVLRSLENIDQCMKKCGKWNDYRYLKIWVIVEIIGVAVLLLSYFIFYNFMYYRVDVQYDKTLTMTRWCLIYLPILTMHIFLMQFTTTVLVMAKQSAMVNRCILNLKCSEYSDKHLILSELRHIYTLLGTTKDKLNRIYSLILLVKFWNQLVNVFVFVYHCVYGYIFIGTLVKPNSVKDYFIPLFASIVIFIEFGIIITVCEKMSKERRKTAKCLEQLLVATFDEHVQHVVSFKTFHYVEFII